VRVNFFLPNALVSMAASMPGDEERLCCAGAALRDCCTCWTPVYDREQAKDQGGDPEVRPEKCGDCACRPDSPERLTPELMNSSVDGVHRLAAEGTPFYCHDGMRRLKGHRHPDGAEVPAENGEEHNYSPPMRPGDRCSSPAHSRGRNPAGCLECDGSGWVRHPVPLRADGRPALICAGWAALAKARGTR